MVDQDVATALLVFGLIAAFLTVVSLFPPYRPGTIALAAWLPGWLISELPIHTALIEVAAAGWLVSEGALDERNGWIGLVLVALSVLGAAQHVRFALRSARAVDAALDAALGDRPPHPPMTHRRRFWELAGVFPFRPRSIERIRDLPYHGRSRRQRLDVYRAADPAARRDRAPVFLYVHGGAWVIGNKGQQGRQTVHRLAAAGWVCVSINYRLSPWATFPDHIVDVKRAIRWVREHVAEYGGDPGFVVIGGGSAGGHLASLAALTPNALEYQRDFPDVDTSLQGCVTYFGVYDFADRDRAFRHSAFRMLLERIVMKRRLGDAPEEFERASPRWRIGPHAPPFLIIHGDRDSLAPLAGAIAFRDALRAASPNPVTYIELPGAQHAFETFPSLRSAAVILGVERWCEWIYTTHARRQAAANTREGARSQA